MKPSRHQGSLSFRTNFFVNGEALETYRGCWKYQGRFRGLVDWPLAFSMSNKIRIHIKLRAIIESGGCYKFEKTCDTEIRQSIRRSIYCDEQTPLQVAGHSGLHHIRAACILGP